MIDRVGGGFKDYAPLILRLGLAIIFIAHGAQRVGDIGRNPHLESILITIVELFGGLFCLIGFMTRWAAFALGALVLWMIIDGPRMYAFYKPDYQIYFASFIMAAALYGLGGGKHSLDEKTKKKD